MKDVNNQLTTERISIPVWMTVEIGGVPKEQLVSALEGEGFFVSDWAKDLMKQDACTVLPEKKSLKLARCTVRDLGFTENPTTYQIKQRIFEVGGQICPAELGPHLRRQLKDQPVGDIVWLIMEQIMDSDSSPDAFYVERRDDGEQWLDARCAYSDDPWYLGFEVVFVLAS